MSTLHHLLGWSVLGFIVAFVLGCALGAGLGIGPRWIERGRLGLTGLVVVELAVGGLLLLGGSRPAEGLHLIYGLALLGVLPLASSFAAEAPARPRALVFAAGGLVMVLLVWRLVATG